MLNANDFIATLGDLGKQILRTANILDSLAAEADDKDLRYELLAMRQAKRRHMEAINALAIMVNSRANQNQGGKPPGS